MDKIFHITSRLQWSVSSERGTYVDDSLRTDGFIHCAFASQVASVANYKFRGERGLVVLEIDPDRLTSVVRVEDLHDMNEEFPHVYGPIETVAVIAVHEVTAGTDGSFSFDALR